MAGKKVEPLEEIVFRDRNKEYGAYFLRKVYKKYTSRSLLISIGVLLICVLVPFFWFKAQNTVKTDTNISAEFTNMPKPPEEAPPPPPPPPPAEQIEQRVRFTAPVVTTDTVDQGTVFNQDDLKETTTNFAPDTAKNISIGETKDQVIEQPEMQVFTIVEEAPTYPGGDVEMFKFLQQNIKYPEVAKENNIQGIAFIEFIVNSNGSISDVKRKEGTKEVGAGCDDEAIRVIRLMPKWVAGKQSGKNVRVRMVLPVKFKLE